MSIDLYLLIKTYIDKRDIERILYEFNFKRDADVENTYFWFNDDYLSTRGCWFGIDYDVDVCIGENEEIQVSTLCSTNTKAGRSYHDVEMQIEVLRRIQNEFGGDIYNPDEGEWGFFENDLPNLSRTEIACGLAYLHYQQNLYKVEMLIEDFDEKEIEKWDKLGIPIFDKSLLRNNILVPFCVSVLETFLKMFFQRYLQTNEEAVNKIFKKKDKLPYNVVRELLSGEKTIIDLELEEYSFQNFNSTNRAFKHYLNFDLFSVLRQTEKFENKEISIISVLTELIEIRHKIIHEAVLDYRLSKKQMEKYHHFLDLFGEQFIKSFMEKHKLRLLLDEEL